MEKSAILLSFLSLWLISYLNSNYLEVIGFILILTFGILHGTNDILIYKTMNKENYNTKKILIYYIGAIATIISLLYFFPMLALIFFTCISAYHFGEQYWLTTSKIETLKNKFVTYFSSGGTILFLLIYLQYEESNKIIYAITEKNIAELYIQYILIIFFLIYGATLFRNFNTSQTKISIGYHLFHLLVFFIIFKVANLIWGFTIFFIFWHSLPSLESQIMFIYGEVTGITIYKYLRKGIIYWGFSIVGLIAVYIYYEDIFNLNSLIFSFLTAITFPHVFVISKMFRK